MKTQTLIHSGLVLLALTVLGTARAEIEPAARALVDASAAKLAAAQTIGLTAKHELEAPLGTGTQLDKGPLQVTVQRPNRIHVLQDAGDETRELAFDGTTFCVMHPKLLHHATEPLKAASIGEFGDLVDQRFGFRPPLAELLADDMSEQLFKHVTEARVVGREHVGWTRCDRIHFVQEGMEWDLWISVKDKLPRRMRFTFVDMPDKPSWDLRMSKWELDGPVDETLFTKRPAAESSAVQMLRAK